MNLISNILPNGMTLIAKSPDYAVDLTGGEWHGWLFHRKPGTDWVSVRKLSGWEVMQAEDQRDAGVVQHGVGVRSA